MSEVYIRSQNKEKLYRLGGNYACVEYGEYEDVKKKRGGAEADKKRHVICISDGCLEEIGEYATNRSRHELCKDGRNHRKGSIYHCGSESRTGCKRWLGTLEEWRRLD